MMMLKDLIAMAKKAKGGKKMKPKGGKKGC